MDSLVSTTWLRNHLGEPDLVVLDCSNFAGLSKNGDRYVTFSGRSSWELGHIPGSNFADFTSGFAGDDTHYRNTLPSMSKFAATMGSLGVGDDSRVVLYDSIQSMWAARVWWMLRWIGFDNAAILDGGWQDWTNSGNPVSTKPSWHQSALLTPRPRPELFVIKRDMIVALNNGATCIVDALSEDQYSGKCSDLGLAGHIPGAVNIPAESLLDPETGYYIPKIELVQRLPVNRNAHTIIYCGSGIAAASVAFSMLLVGFSNIAIYMPGLQEWMRDGSLPQACNAPERKQHG